MKSTYTLGMNHRVNQITIGKSKKAHLCVSELKLDIEFTVKKEDEKIILQKATGGNVIFTDDPQIVSTSNSALSLWIGLDALKLNRK